jgi:PhzF family phenazine biosynthesis protein
MSSPLFQVDAFTSLPFTGNPAAVCLLDAPGDADWMQQVAAEMNLAETAFVAARPDGYDLRWFTPVVEVDLCGHATLASAHVLWETGRLGRAAVARFHTRSGVLTATSRGDWIELDFPSTPETTAEPPPGLIEALGVRPLYVGRSKFDYLVQVAHEEEVRALSPDMAALRRIDARGVMVTSESATSDADFVSRFFGPGSGIDEDPATGSAHCCLGPFWHRLMGKSDFVARQISVRGGVIRVRLAGDRVLLQGQAVTVVVGEVVV